MRSLELFGGAGGLAIATARAGFEHEAVIEWDRNACDTLRLNARPRSGHAESWKIIEGDVTGHDFCPYRDRIEFVSGGPPCQPFSLGGNHLGQNDHRNMFPQAVRAVDLTGVCRSELRALRRDRTRWWPRAI